MSPTLSLIIYCLLIVLASLAGGWIPHVIKLTHKRMELAVSFVAGVMLGVGLLHMLPHAVEARMEAMASHRDGGGGTMVDHLAAHALIGPIVLWLLAGFLVMFFIERFFSFHHHDAPAPEPDSEDAHEHVGAVDVHEAHETAAHHHHAAPARHHLTWTGAAIGLSVHSLIEGVALAASVEVGRRFIAGAGGARGPALAGLGTFLVIFLHKPFDSLTIATLMSVGGRSAGLRHLVNIAFSLLVIAGVLLFEFGVLREHDGPLWISGALAFSAGTFLCIAMSDLLPELQFHHHDRGKLSAALLSGLALAWIIGMMETRMDRDQDPSKDGLPSSPRQPIKP